MISDGYLKVPDFRCHRNCRPNVQITGIKQGFRTSPARSSPHLWPPDGTEALGLVLELRIPPLPATHVEEGTDPGTTWAT